MSIKDQAMAGLGALHSDPHSVRQRVEVMERLLERSFTIPGTRQTFGLDVILEVIPVVGDVAAAALGSYMLWEARNLKMSKLQMSRMAGNVGVDFLLGLIPGVGLIPDFFFRSNSRNLKIIKRHLDKHHAAGARIDAAATEHPEAAHEPSLIEDEHSRPM